MFQSLSQWIATEFQSTLPRRERQLLELPRHFLFCISIHAPAKGATLHRINTGISVHISIHAPAKGATESSILFIFFSCISIHAPAKGATLLTFAITFLPHISIHASAKGATKFCISLSAIVSFQSTLPRRERPDLDIYVKLG